MKYIFDANIAVQVVNVLKIFPFGHSLVHQYDDDRFKPESEDTFIIQTLSSENPKPVWLTSDLQFKNTPEREALADSGLMVVFFRKTFHNQPAINQARKALEAWPRLLRQIEACVRPTALQVRQNGNVEVLGPTADL